MRIFKTIILCFFAISFAGCAALLPMNESDYKKEFTFDYSVPGKTKSEIFKAARENLALSYGDSNKVFRVVDEAEGTILGKGIVSWIVAPGGSGRCDYDYNIKFLSKDEKARLILTITGISSTQLCGWEIPPAYGYEQMKENFNAINASLDAALKAKTDSAKDNW